MHNNHHCKISIMANLATSITEDQKASIQVLNHRPQVIGKHMQYTCMYIIMHTTATNKIRYNTHIIMYPQEFVFECLCLKFVRVLFNYAFDHLVQQYLCLFCALTELIYHRAHLSQSSFITFK